jgi:DNA-binding transcriptional ArsR family regulator
MPKLTLDMITFKALASDTRLEILKALDGKKLNLKELSGLTKLNKATLHEHLGKLYDVGLIKRNEREGHKWVYYKLTWKGESLLHPENTRIVVMFSTTFVALALGIIHLINYTRSKIDISLDRNLNRDGKFFLNESDKVGETISGNNDTLSPFIDNNLTVSHEPIFLYVSIIFFIIFIIFSVFSIWRYKKNRNLKL